MQKLFLFGAVARLATAQLINLAPVYATPPVLVTPAVNVAAQTATYSPVPTFSAANPTDSGTALSAVTPTQHSQSRREIIERDGNCAPNPVPGYGPVPSPDTPQAFLADQDFQEMAEQATTADGFKAAFVNLQGSVTASTYMGLYTMQDYNTTYCANLCNQNAGCVAFNIYTERDPSVIPNTQQCSNPPSETVYKCTLWGAPITAQEATNTGQWEDKFQIVITASNGYNRVSTPFISGWSNPVEFSGAISAPLGQNNYTTSVGSQYTPFSQANGYDPTVCAQACYDMNSAQHGATCGIPVCTFFNSFVVSENGIPQGMYCNFYNQTWTNAQATNYGQTVNGQQYSYNQSVGYSLPIVDNCDLVSDPYFAATVTGHDPTHIGAWTASDNGDATLLVENGCHDDESCLSITYPSYGEIYLYQGIKGLVGGQSYVVSFDYSMSPNSENDPCVMALAWGEDWGMDVALYSKQWTTFSRDAYDMQGDAGSTLSFNINCWVATTFNLTAVHIYASG